jgi:hypothetical protein
MYMATFDLTNPDAFAFQQKTKPIWNKESGLPKFSLKGGWADTSNSGGQNMWQNTGVSFTLAPKKTPNFQVSSSGITHQVQPKGGIQTTTGYIMKDTLEKGGAQTILGMSEQRDKNNNIIQGANYANPSFSATVSSGVRLTRKQQVDNQQQKVQNIMDARGSASLLPPALQGGDVEKKFVESQRNTAHGISSSPTSMSSQVNKRNLVRRANRYANFETYARTDPTIAFANTIQDKLGRSKIKAYIKRRSWLMKDGVTRQYSKRYEGALTGDPNAVIKDYYKKTRIIDWAKEINPGHANLDDETVNIVDKKWTTPYYWKGNLGDGGIGKWPAGIYHQAHISYKDVPATSIGNKGDHMDLLYDKIKKANVQKKKKYETYYEPIVTEEDKAKLTEQEIHDKEFDTYAYTDKDFTNMETLKQLYISEIGMRRENQEFVIDTIGSDVKTLDKKDRSDNLIPTLDLAHKKLDTKATVLKKQVGNYDWQKKISQDSFGTDTIQGDSHVSAVLDSYGGKVRGGNYYSQDVGNLSRKTKVYEKSLEEDIKQQEKDIKNIELDETDGLVDYFNETSDKEYATASKEYLSKSLTLTKEEREQLEKERQRQAFGENQQAQIHKTTQSRGRPSLKDVSKRQYKNTRTRGGQNTFGGLVI